MPASEPMVACGTGIPLQDGVQINTGQTYFYNGTGATFSNVTVQGGTLVICGTVTFSNFNFNSGSVVIKPGGVTTFSGSFNTGNNLGFYNHGTTTFNVPIFVQGNVNFVYNASGASMNATNSLTVFNGGEFVNEGTAIGASVLLNSGAVICLGPSSVSAVASITNNALNPVTVPVGTACVSYSQSFTGNTPISASPNLRICQQPGATAPQPPLLIGNAVLISNCTSCLLGTIPLRLVSFTGNEFNGAVKLEWTTAFEENLRSFAVQRGDDGQRFESIGEVGANNSPSTYHYNTSISSKYFFRLKIIDADGSFTYSSLVLLDPAIKRPGWRLLANPVTGSFAELSITMSKNQRGELIITDNTGRQLKKKEINLLKGNNFVRIDISNLVSGKYYLSLNCVDDRKETISFARIQ